MFAVISIVNFMVITKGSGRMAEVSARFALDSLPGKQLAIDGDLNSGAITHEEAKRRRLAAGELGLDIYDMRPRLAEKGLKYI